MLREQLPSTPRRMLGVCVVSVFALATAFAAWSAQPQVREAPAGIGSDSTLPLSAPQYPAEALQHNVSGKVVLRVDVGPDGVPTQVQVEQSEPAGVFDAAAVEAAKRWKFNPASKDGKPVAGQVLVPIEFQAEPWPAPMKVAPGHDPDPAAYDWSRIDMAAVGAKEIGCDVVRGDPDRNEMYCGVLRK